MNVDTFIAEYDSDLFALQIYKVKRLNTMWAQQGKCTAEEHFYIHTGKCTAEELLFARKPVPSVDDKDQRKLWLEVCVNLIHIQTV